MALMNNAEPPRYRRSAESRKERALRKAGAVMGTVAIVTIIALLVALQATPPLTISPDSNLGWQAAAKTATAG